MPLGLVNADKVLPCCGLAKSNVCVQPVTRVGFGHRPFGVISDKSRVRWAFELFGPNFRLLLTNGLGRFAAFHMAELRFARRF